MKLHEWNARLHGLVIFRSLLSDPVAAKFAALIDCLTAGNSSVGSVCNAVAQFESVLFERTTKDESGRVVEYTRSIYRGDRYRITAHLRFDDTSG